MTERVQHLPDGRCPVVLKAYAYLGETLAEYVLWEKTCFPMSDDIAMEQLEAFLYERSG